MDSSCNNFCATTAPGNSASLLSLANPPFSTDGPPKDTLLTQPLASAGPPAVAPVRQIFVPSSPRQVHIGLSARPPLTSRYEVACTRYPQHSGRHVFPPHSPDVIPPEPHTEPARHKPQRLLLGSHGIIPGAADLQQKQDSRIR